MFIRKLKLLLLALALGGNVLTLHAQMAQDPLLSRSASVEPNIAFVFDDSGSMAAEAIYQYGDRAHGLGMSGPNNDGESSGNWYDPPSPHGKSPDVNLIYYDPRVTYKLRINADGTSQPKGDSSHDDSFKVYFYKTGSTTYSVKSVKVVKPGGGFATSVNAVFPVPTGVGGSQAKATVTLKTVNVVTSIEVTDGGKRYNKVPEVIVDHPGGGGVRATATAFVNRDGRVYKIEVDNPGSGYTSRPGVWIDDPGRSNDRQATARAEYGPMRMLDKINVTNAGSGYLTKPQLKLDNQPSGYKGATWEVEYNTHAGAILNAKWNGTGADATDTGSYFSPSYPPDTTSPLAMGASLINYPITASKSTAKYPKFRNRTDCVEVTHCSWAEERQNYANWKKYHSTRLNLAKTGIGLAFQPLNPTFRLGWGTINRLKNSSGSLDKGVRKFDSTVQKDFLDWLYARNASGSTPNRTALDKVGRYFQRGDNNGPWADTPNGDGTISVSGSVKTHATCRRSYTMLMTDGYYNEETISLSDVDTADGPAISKPSAFQYRPIGPYSDTVNNKSPFSSTMADVAMKYYLTDLRPDLDNYVKPVPGDEGFWQHMNFYAIGLGVVGTLDNADPAVLQSLTGTDGTSPKRTRSWPAPKNDDPTSIDDMWHAAINGRGKLLNAKTSQDLNDAVTQMMADIGGNEGTQAGVAVSTASLTKETKKYTPTYATGTWNGNLTAYNLDESTGSQTGVAWEVEHKVGTDPVTGAGIYTSTMPDAIDRRIFVGTGLVAGSRAVPFTYSDMSTAGLLGQMKGTVNTSLINYLRGDAANEDTSASEDSPTAIYRGRETRLGDIVNSTPVYVKDSIDLLYERLPVGIPGQSSYRTFIAAKNARAEGVIFVGANDGMLHAFRDGTFGPGGDVMDPGGVEVFAYVPHAVLPTINQLADKTYTHRYYVDGPNTETDAYINGKWSNIVLGSTGGGSGSTLPLASGISPRTGVFAIDVTALNSSATALSTSSVLWEVGSAQSTYAEVGYVLHDIQAGITPDGTWVAIFGNGYESKSCQARLFVVNLETGAKIKEINTGVGNCSTQKNGLGGVRLVRNSSQQVIGAYAGDLQGNMWKFNLNNTSTSSWGVDLAGVPLFSGIATQPITAPPTAIPLPMLGTSKPDKGYMVLFGTGKFYEVTDISSVDKQHLYGIWDPLPFGAATIPVGTPLVQADVPTRLVEQKITVVPKVVVEDDEEDNGNTYFAITSHPVDYTSVSPKRGWYMALPNTGQRMVYPFDMLLDRFAVVDTISPANVSLDPCTKAGSGTGYLYVIDAFNGGGPTEAILDTNGDNNVNEKDMIVSGVESYADGRNVTLEVEKNDLELVAANVSGGDPGSTLMKISCKLTNTCKAPPGGVKRQWRQLFLR